MFVSRLALASDVYRKLKAKCDERRPRRRAFSDAMPRAAASSAWRRLGAM